MAPGNLNKFIKEAGIESKNVNKAAVDLLVITCTKAGNRKVRIKYGPFLTMLGAIAEKRFPTTAKEDPIVATERLLKQFVIPLGEKIIKVPIEESFRSDPQVKRLLQQLNGVLKTLFSAYAEGISLRSGAKDHNWAVGFDSGAKTPRGRGLSIGGGGVTGIAPKGLSSHENQKSLSQEELIKLAEDLEIVPKMLSKMEVGRLLKATSGAEKTLSFEQFLHWLCRAALRGFSKAPFEEELPTAADKVEKMLSLIDNSKIVQSILAARGKRHNRTFARKHHESVARGAIGRSQSAAARVKEVVEETKLHIARSEYAEEFNSVFNFYCSYGEEGPMDTMKGFMFYKLFRDCELLDDVISHERIDLIFLQHVGGVDGKANKKLRMNYDEYISAVSDVATRKFPGIDRLDALMRLVVRHIVPGAAQAEEVTPTIPSLTSGTVRDVLNRDGSRRTVRGLFLYYSRATLGAKEMRRVDRGTLLSLKDVMKFADDFGISKRVIQHQELVRIFRASVGIGVPMEESIKCVEYAMWQQLLCRLAMHWGRIDHTATPEEVAQRLHKFLRSLDNSEAMVKVEDWEERAL